MKQNLRYDIITLRLLRLSNVLDSGTVNILMENTQLVLVNAKCYSTDQLLILIKAYS